MEQMNSDNHSNGLTLVLGGTGKTGRRIAERLISQGVSTRIACRPTTPSFDWGDESNWGNVLEGVTSVYLSYAPDLAVPGATDSIQTFVDKAVKRGVQRIVLLSGRGEEEAQLCERIVQKAGDNSGIEWTVVRCSWFSQNFSEGEFIDMVLAGAVTLPAGDVPEPFVDADDIADVAFAALTEGGHAGQIYELTGPRMLTFAQAIAEIAQATKREIQYIQTPREAFTQGLAETGAPKDAVWLLDYLFSTVLDGRNSRLCDGVQRALGREPRDFAEYARRTADSGVWDLPSTDQTGVA